MKLPNCDRAVVDLVKLRDYCLSEVNPRGKHKARVFRAALGLTVGDAEELRQALLDRPRLARQQTGQRISGASGIRWTSNDTGRALGLGAVRMDRAGQGRLAGLTSCYLLEE